MRGFSCSLLTVPCSLYTTLCISVNSPINQYFLHRTDTNKERFKQNEVSIIEHQRNHHQGRAGAQPEERQPHHPPEQADRDDRPFRQRQEFSGLRHHLCRGSAALCGIAVELRPAVPGADGEAGRGLHRGPVPRHIHRPEDHQPQPPLHRGHGDGDPRLPAPDVRPDRRATLSQVRKAHPAADRGPDRGPDPGPARAHEADDTGPGGAGPQGRIREDAGGHDQARLRPRPHRRRAVRAVRPAQAGQEQEAHGGDRDRPPCGAPGHPAAPHRFAGDRHEAGGGAGGRVGHRRRRYALQPELRLPGLWHLHRRADPPHVLFQQPLRRVPHLLRAGHADENRPGHRHTRP